MSEWPTTFDHDPDIEARIAARESGPRRGPIDRPAAGSGAPRERGVAPLTRILRIIGAVALLASASTFLIQRWQDGGDLGRYFTLVAHPALVAGIGIFCGTRLRDTKSARTFLAIAAAFVPVLSCVLGGLLLSRFGTEGVLATLPVYATWVAGSSAAALLALAVTAAVAVPVVGFSFLALARARAWPLALTYLLGNAILLLPTRDPEAVTLLAGTYFVGLVGFEWRSLSRDAALRTLEGMFVRAMLLAPPVLMMVRNALHYDVSAAWFMGVFGAFSIASLAFAQVARLDEPLQRLFRLVGLGNLTIAAGFAAETAVSLGLPSTYALPLAAVVFALGATAFSILAAGEEWGEQFRIAGAVGLLAGLTVDLMQSPDVLTSALCFAASIGTLCIGWMGERRPLFLAGIAGVVFALAFHIRYAVILYAYTRWGSLALLGTGVILVAGYLDKNGQELGPRLRQLRARVAAW